MMRCPDQSCRLTLDSLPQVTAAIQDMQRDGASMRKVMNDPTMSKKIERLIAAGVLQVK